MKEPDTL